MMKNSYLKMKVCCLSHECHAAYLMNVGIECCADVYMCHDIDSVTPVSSRSGASSSHAAYERDFLRDRRKIETAKRELDEKRKRLEFIKAQIQDQQQEERRIIDELNAVDAIINDTRVNKSIGSDQHAKLKYVRQMVMVMIHQGQTR